MILQLLENSEKVEKYREFEGPFSWQMPLLISGKNLMGEKVDVIRFPASFADIITLRMNKVRYGEHWRHKKYFTGDALVYGPKGSKLLVHDAKALREVGINAKYWRRIVLSQEEFEELKTQEGTLYLSTDQQREIRRKGWVRKNGVFVPENYQVARVWDFLSRGRKDLAQYAQLALSSQFSRNNKVMKIYWEEPPVINTEITLHPWTTFSRGSNFGTYANDYSLSSEFYSDRGTLVGIAKFSNLKDSIDPKEGGLSICPEVGALTVVEENLEERVQVPWWQRLKF